MLMQATKRFPNRQDGSVAIVFAIGMLPLMICIGAAIDTASWFSARRATGSAIDAALLVGARLAQFNPSDPQQALDKAQSYYANFKATRPNIINDTVQFAFSDNNTQITFTGDAYIKTTFLQVAGVTQLKLTTPSKAVFATSGANGGSDLEIALSLDVTSSMCDDGMGPCYSGTKITALKTAAKDLVNIVLGNTAPGMTSRVALIPWATNIRVAADGEGAALMTALTNLPTTYSAYIEQCTGGSGGTGESGSYVCPSYQTVYEADMKIMPCVTDRFYSSSDSFDYTDAPPSTGAWLNGISGSRSASFVDSSETVQTTGLGQTAADPLKKRNHKSNGNCWDSAQTNIVMPLTASKSDLDTRIDGLQAYASTGGALGTAWAYYMLSPRWSSIWQGSSTPGSYSDVTTTNSAGAPLLRKVAVIMTDGDFNTYRGWKDQSQSMISDAAVATCAEMKNSGIEVFTVGFNLDALPSDKKTIAVNTLKACGTDVSHFYESITSNDLIKAFRDIALKVKPVRLTQ